MICLDKPVYIASKKYYAGGEVVIECVTQDNKEDYSRVEMTFRNKEAAEKFELGKAYLVSFQMKG